MLARIGSSNARAKVEKPGKAKMEAGQIEAFQAAAVFGAFTRGAEALGITQPALTRSIARLEADIGFALFERGHGPARLTPEGATFLREVERRFVGVDQVRPHRSGHPKSRTWSTAHYLHAHLPASSS